MTIPALLQPQQRGTFSAMERIAELETRVTTLERIVRSLSAQLAQLCDALQQNAERLPGEDKPTHQHPTRAQRRGH